MNQLTFSVLKSLLSIKGQIDVEKALNNLTMAEIKSITLHPEELFTRCGHLLALPYRVADFFILCYWSLNLSNKVLPISDGFSSKSRFSDLQT